MGYGTPNMVECPPKEDNYVAGAQNGGGSFSNVDQFLPYIETAIVGYAESGPGFRLGGWGQIDLEIRRTEFPKVT